MTVGSAGMALVLGVAHTVGGAPALSVPAILVAVAKYTAIYFPATFALEEVAFRGALDAHVHHEGDSRPWSSAILVSALWGLWHLPISTGLPLPVLLVTLPAAHIVLGVPLSFAWRRTRNLTGPAFAHAAIDAVRNALLGL
jgi:membrane protease YdiL (CAAX protease family)